METRFKELLLSVEDSIRHRTIQKTVLLQGTSKHLGRPSLAGVSIEVETLAAVKTKNSTVTIFESVISNQSADSNRSFVDFLISSKMSDIYCAEQIKIPPAYPNIIKQYAKAAIRTQPYDLLQWTCAYFRALANCDIPPVKVSA